MFFLQEDRLSFAHSRMEHYFFSYLLTCEVYLIKVLEIMAQILQYITFLSLKAIKVSSDFILNYLKKVVGGATTQKYQKQTLKWPPNRRIFKKSCRGRHHSEI